MNHLRFFYYVVFACLLCSTVAAAEDSHPDFSGTWVVDKDKSRPGRPVRGGLPDITLSITQEGDTIALKQVSTFQGRDRTQINEYIIGGDEVISQTRRNSPRGTMVGESTTKAKWDKKGATLLITSDTVFETQRGSMRMTAEREFKLSEDGKQMSIEEISDTPRGSMNAFWVYKKEE